MEASNGSVVREAIRTAVMCIDSESVPSGVDGGRIWVPRSKLSALPAGASFTVRMLVAHGVIQPARYATITDEERRAFVSVRPVKTGINLAYRIPERENLVEWATNPPEGVLRLRLNVPFRQTFLDLCTEILRDIRRGETEEQRAIWIPLQPVGKLPRSVQVAVGALTQAGALLAIDYASAEPWQRAAYRRVRDVTQGINTMYEASCGLLETWAQHPPEIKFETAADDLIRLCSRSN